MTKKGKPPFVVSDMLRIEGDDNRVCLVRARVEILSYHRTINEAVDAATAAEGALDNAELTASSPTWGMSIASARDAINGQGTMGLYARTRRSTGVAQKGRRWGPDDD